MVRYRSIVSLLGVLLVAACAVPAGSPIVVPSSAPSAAPSASPSEAAPPSEGPASPSAMPSATPVEPTPSATVAPTPTGSPGETMTVRAYYLMADVSGGGPTLVPVLRTVPKSPGVARAALTALLAGPTDVEAAADPSIGTAIPDGSTLLGITIDAGLATVDLSGDFATGDGGGLHARLAQVVYTVTQFASVDRVRFELDGEPVESLAEGVVLDAPVTRVTYRDDFLPAIFVDRPVWGASLADPARVSGLANVFEAQFRIALLDGAGHVLLDRPVMATCGSGCWGRFDLTMTYQVSKAQLGTLRVWDPSEKDGTPESVREYPVYLRATP
jgi:germination protein M